MNNINCVLEEKSKCFGCRACFNICTAKAISMQEDEEGFFYPVVDIDKCTNCGLCKKACPSLNKSEVFKNNTKDPACYAAMASDDIRKVSSSGGVFSVIADEIFRQGGVVCGVAFVGQKVQHIIIDNPGDMVRLRGSKYVQSDTNTVYPQIKDILKTGKMVLFTGTPCQVAGLNVYLGKTYPNLITVDLICHGVPPQRVFDKYLEETLTDKEKGDFYHTSFRNKAAGWNVYATTTTTTTGYKYYGRHGGEDSFLYGFINNLSLRPCCGICPYTSTQREADITIGDFWKIERFKPELNDKKGTSLILVNNTKKGEKLFNLIKNKFNILEKVPIEYAKYYNITLYTPLKQNINRNKFFMLLNAGKTLKETINSCKEKADIGILNLWPFKNYGGVLVAYALQKVLKKLGYSSRLINWQFPNWREKYSGSFIEDFANKYLDFTTPYYNYSDLIDNVNNLADTFIVGADCVWSPFWFKDSLFFFPFVDSSKKKISYAPSFMNEHYDCPPDLLLSNKYYLSRFDSISVREDSGLKILKDVFNTEATQVLDPTLLLDKNDYSEIIRRDHASPDRDYVCVYLIHSKETLFEDLKQKISILVDNKKIIILRQQESEKSVSEWLELIINSKVLITNSYHACCFATLFNIPFYVYRDIIQRKVADYSRHESLMRILGLENRIKYDVNDFDKDMLFDPIDWAKVNIRLEKDRIRSLDWLKEALEKPKDVSGINPSDPVIHYLNKSIIQLQKTNSRKLSAEDLFNVLNYRKNYFTYLFYRIIKYFSFGKMRESFRNKQKYYCGKVLRVRALKKK